jgi:hypothetical protein
MTERKTYPIYDKYGYAKNEYTYVFTDKDAYLKWFNNFNVFNEYLEYRMIEEATNAKNEKINK